MISRLRGNPSSQCPLGNTNTDKGEEQRRNATNCGHARVLHCHSFSHCRVNASASEAPSLYGLFLRVRRHRGHSTVLQKVQASQAGGHRPICGPNMRPAYGQSAPNDRIANLQPAWRKQGSEHQAVVSQETYGFLRRVTNLRWSRCRMDRSRTHNTSTMRRCGCGSPTTRTCLHFGLEPWHRDGGPWLMLLAMPSEEVINI
mmetsp:Transcript_75765/g.149766  ORF Transcript_75765/g.149766 Transcript_75765/m.149766 type:complete len:201 (-) Transcript_75765:3297-3899(-)